MCDLVYILKAGELYTATNYNLISIGRKLKNKLYLYYYFIYLRLYFITLFVFKLNTKLAPRFVISG